MQPSDRSRGRALGRRTVLKGGAAVLAASAFPSLSFGQTPKKGGTLRVSNGGDPPDFDLHQTATYLTEFVGSPCYSTLLRNDSQDYNKLVPDLAASYTISPDGLTVTFTLRSGVLFHNGMQLTSEDVAYSLERIRKPPKGIVSPRRGLLNNIKAVETPDPLTVVLYLTAPQPDIPYLVSNPFNVIYPKKVVEPLDAQGIGMKRQIIGTGPFRLERAIDGQLYELTRFDKYFGQPAYLDKIQFFPIKGEIERGVALQGKRIDAGFFFANESVLQTLKKVPGVTALRRPTPTFINLIPNLKLKPFDDIRVRNALSLAVDRTAFINTVGPLAGAFFHSLGLMPPESPFALTPEQVKAFPGYDTLPDLGGSVEANRKKAMALLAEAGVPKGFKIAIISRGDVPAFRDGAINVAAQLAAVGLDASVDIRDAGAFYAAESRGDFQLVVHSVAVSGSLPDQVLGEGYTSFGGRNYGGWSDEAIDALYRQQSAELDPAKRVDLIRQFQLKFMATQYQVNLAWVGYGAAHLDTMHGWQAQPNLYTNMQMGQVWLG